MHFRQELRRALPTVSGAGHRSCNRLAEWVTSSIMVAVGIGAARQEPHDLLALFALWLGIARWSALWMNGQGLPYSAQVRAIGSALSGFAWLQLLVTVLATPLPPLAYDLLIATLPTMALSDLLSAFRAWVDMGPARHDARK